MKKVVIGNFVLEYTDKETIQFLFMNKEGKQQVLPITLPNAMEVIHVLAGWICQSWLD